MPRKVSDTWRRGQSITEVAVLMGIALAAFAAMVVYLQRGYQGYLYATSSGHGSQFDPRQPFTGDSRLRDYTVVMESKVTRETPSVEQFGGYCPDNENCLPSTPGGPGVGMILDVDTPLRTDAITRTTTKVNTTWSVSRDATYEAK